MKIDLSGRSALVTGGSRGIGRAVALGLAAAGADVVAGYRTDRGSAAEVVRRIRESGGSAKAARADLSRPRGADALVRAVGPDAGPDILVNNAGIWKGAPADRMTDQEWREMMGINLDAVFRLCRAAIPTMRRRGWGRIINVSSTAGQRGEAGHSHYAATKGAIISFTKSLAVELARDGITVNAVAPGWVATDMTVGTLRGKRRDRVVAGIPLGRVGRPDEIAAPVVFLASDASSFITGEVLNVNGGAVLCG